MTPYELEDAVLNANPHDSNSLESLINDACEAEELFDYEELEEYANNL